MKTDWSNYSITYDGITYDLQYRDKVNLIACEDYTPNSPSPDYPSPIVSIGDPFGIDFAVTGYAAQTYSAHRDVILRSLPDGTCDTYDALTGTVTRNVGVKVFDGTESLSEASDISGYHRYYISGLPMPEQGYVSGVCTHYHVITANPASYIGDVMRLGNSLTKGIYIYTSMTLPETQTFLAAQYAAGTPVAVQYKLAAPITEHINPAPLPTYPRYTHVEQIQDGLKGTIEATVRVVEK